MRQKSFIRRALIVFFFSLVIIFSWSRSFASSQAIRLESTEISKILSALEEDKMGGPELREKIRDKLSTLDHKQILLIASLSERIANENRTTGREIAILLITALIVFS
jgi:hypothetical protein